MRKYGDFSPLHKTWNSWLDADLYGQRSQKRNGELPHQKEIWRIRPFTTLVEAVP
jgi:hypothetical protein